MVASLLSMSLVACGEDEPDDNIDSGVVIERARRTVVVLEDDGEKDKHRIRKRSIKCQVGERWPECKEGYAPANK